MDQAERDPNGLRRGVLNVRIVVDETECWFDAPNPRDACILVERFLRHLGRNERRPEIHVEGQDLQMRSRVLQYIAGVLLEIYAFETH
jgi:hypothetical protein